MATIKLWKKYADGKVKSLEVNDTKENIMHMFDHGFFLSEAEAKSGKVAEAKKPAAKKATAKPKTVKVTAKK